MEAYLKQIDRRALDGRLVDLLLVVPANFGAELEKNGRPPLYVLTREKDDRSRLVSGRVAHILGRWKKQLKDVRLVRKQLPPGYDDPFALRDPEQARPAAKRATEDLFDILVRVFPFVLVMWALAGALYPAVDLCAGEKERGTMETLLISPASREEIVWGKFLTIWVFSAFTALLNLASMGLTTWQFSGPLPATGFRPSAVFWGVALLLPLSAFFSAVCLSVGAYARSSKEGQYYLMPLFLLTMPLIFLTLAPGVELNAFYSMVPVTGVALLLQKLMAAGTPDRELWLYFLPVLAPMIIYSWLALRWAIEQFQREEVLFREAERLDIGLWLRRLLRDKEALPSSGQALFCFGLIFVLGWITLSVAHPGDVLVQVGIRYVAFVAAPALFMALLLTTRPREGLALRLPPYWGWLVAPALALLLFLPATELTYFILQQFPGIRDAILRGHQDALQGTTPLLGGQTSAGARIQALLVLAVLPALCEELAFRGFILTGLSRRFRPRTAIFLSSFLFALAQMNVFQFIPHFILGAVMALLVLRTRSLFPAVLFHLVHNGLVYAPAAFPGLFEGVVTSAASFSGPLLLLTALSAALAGLLLARLARHGRQDRDGGPAAAPTEERIPPGPLRRTPTFLSPDLTRQTPS
jgi:sodium transport system permease protein